MRVLIEKYRGIEINFDTDKEIFETEVKDLGKESKSFAAAKKWIDEYLKDNAQFEPFYVIADPNGYRANSERLKIVGIRKDGRFVYEENGEKKQLSDYNEKDYLLEEPEHNKQLAGLAVLKLEVEEAQNKLSAAKKLITGTSLASIKANYIQP